MNRSGARAAHRDVRTALTTAVAITFAASACASGIGTDRKSAEESPRAETRSGGPDLTPGIVDAAEARELVAAGVKVVDVRTPAEFAAGHVPGAVNIPFDEMAKRAGELGPPATPVLLYCRSGRRSGIASEVLREKGFTRLYDLRSYELWVASEPGATR